MDHSFKDEVSKLPISQERKFAIIDAVRLAETLWLIYPQKMSTCKAESVNRLTHALSSNHWVPWNYLQ